LENLGGIIVLAGMAAWVFIVYLGLGKKTKNQKQKGGKDMDSKFYDNGEIISIGKSFTDLEPATPFAVSEKKLVTKRDKALGRASKRAKLAWKDRKELRKLAGRNLLELTQQTSDDLREAMTEKFRSDLNVFVTSHNMRNMANLEKLKLAFEEALTQAYAGSSSNRMNHKIKILTSIVEKMGGKAEKLKRASLNSNSRYAGMAVESIERMLQNTILEIEGLKVRMNPPHFQD